MGEKCSKALVIFFNILFWVSGCAMVGVGVWFLYDLSYANFFTLYTLNQLPQEIVQYTGFATIGFGGLIIFVGFFGCCGAIQNSKCMLGTYVFFLLLICILEIGLGLITLYFRFYMPDMSGSLRSKLQRDYDQDGPYNNVFTKAVDFTQYEMECCGILGKDDYAQSKFQNKSMQESSRRVPLTCCVAEKSPNWQELEPWTNPKLQNERNCQSGDPGIFNHFLYENGCYDKLNEWYMLHNCIALGTCGGLALLEILAVLSSICLFRNLGDEEY